MSFEGKYLHYSVIGQNIAYSERSTLTPLCHNIQAYVFVYTHAEQISCERGGGVGLLF